MLLVFSGGISMKEDKLRWCCRQKRGISLVEPNDNLAKAYLKNASETLEKMKILDGSWKIITAYYACYNALYGILQKCGIKSEIHECSIELMGLFKQFSSEDCLLLRELKDNRIDVQYYLKEPRPLGKDKVVAFVEKCMIINDSINADEIEKIKSNISLIINGDKKG